MSTFGDQLFPYGVAMARARAREALAAQGVPTPPTWGVRFLWRGPVLTISVYLGEFASLADVEAYVKDLIAGDPIPDGWMAVSECEWLAEDGRILRATPRG